MTEEHPSAALSRLAEVHGIATSFWSFFGDRTEVPAPTLRAILASMGVPASSEDEVAEALSAQESAPWFRLLPPSHVTRPGVRPLVTYVADGHDVAVSVALEDGSWRDLPIPEQRPASRLVDGVLTLKIPVAAAAQPRKVAIGSGAPAIDANVA